MKRSIITIDEGLCNGCGICVRGCHEGALKMIDGKARIISELYCDGLGACIGDCPVRAITIEERDAEPYDEIAVMERISPKGEDTILAHLRHLKEYNEMGYVNEAINFINERGINVNLSSLEDSKHTAVRGCSGGIEHSFSSSVHSEPTASLSHSQLTHWPVQLHLIRPNATHLHGADILLAADCTAYAYAGFHSDLLKGKKLAIACPKLDSNKDIYIEKLIAMIDISKINTLTIAIMEVPCCGGLLQIAKSAAEGANRKIPIKLIVISRDGEIVKDEWI